MEIDKYNSSWHEMSIDWKDPNGNTCDDWDNSIYCNWGDYGVILISGDDNYDQDPNWAEISNSVAANAMYRARAWNEGYDNDEELEIVQTRILINNTLVRTLGSLTLYSRYKYLCMPVVNSVWDAVNFRWVSDPAECE